MRIALDYDETFTEDEILWRFFVEKAVERGHHVRFVTSRSASDDNRDIEQDSQLLGIGITYCEGQAKRRHHQADVWIDDTPEAICP